MSTELALALATTVFGLLVVVGSAELVWLRAFFADDGVFRFATLRRDRELAALEPVLVYPRFVALVVLRGVAGVVLVVAPIASLAIESPLAASLRALVALATAFTVPSSLLVSMRFRGAFNGGSDAMTLVLALGLGLAQVGDVVALTQPALGGLLVEAGLAYVAAQSLLSYVVAGAVKLANPLWRNGTALPSFLDTYYLGVPRALARGVLRVPGPRLASWGVFGVQLLAPLALLDARLAVVFCGLVFTFHVGNVAAFGLNRFLLAWTATYPAIIHLASRVDALGLGAP